MTLARESAQRLRDAAVDTLTQIIRCLTEAVAYSKGQNYQKLVGSWNETHETTISSREGWLCDELSTADSIDSDAEFDAFPENAKNKGNQDNASILGFWQKAITKQATDAKKQSTLEKETDKGHEKTDHLRVAFGIAKEKDVQVAKKRMQAFENQTIIQDANEFCPA